MATALLVTGSTPNFGYFSLYPPARTQASLKGLGCSYNCRQLTYSLFQLTHMSCDDHAIQLIKPQWRPRQNISTLPQGWVSARKHQCTTAITTMWTDSSWAFPESYTADDSWIVRSSDGGQRADKRAHNSTTKVSFCTIIICLSQSVVHLLHSW